MTTTFSTISGSETDVSDEALEELRMLVRGNVLTPGDEAYEPVRAPYNAMQVDRPALIVQCSGTADVVDTVNFARANGLEVAVRGGGHSVAGLSSSNGGMLIDLALMNGVFVDAEARLARVQGGALWGDVDRETQLHGLVTPGGIVSGYRVARVDSRRRRGMDPPQVRTLVRQPRGSRGRRRGWASAGCVG